VDQVLRFVQTYDTRPKRRLFETLRSHGMQLSWIES
jgi:hypothetical protein